MPSPEYLVYPDVVCPREGGGRALGFPSGLPVSWPNTLVDPFFLLKKTKINLNFEEMAGKTKKEKRKEKQRKEKQATFNDSETV